MATLPAKESGVEKFGNRMVESTDLFEKKTEQLAEKMGKDSKATDGWFQRRKKRENLASRQPHDVLNTKMVFSAIVISRLM